MRMRLVVSVVVVIGVMLAGAGIAAVQYGAQAVQIGGGGQSINATRRPVWIGIEIRNASATPVTLREFVPRDASNLRVTAARVLDFGAGRRSGVGMLSEPLDDLPRIRRAIEAGRPLDGYVLAPHSGTRYQVAVRVQRIAAGGQAVLGGAAIVYSVFGLEQGALYEGASCIRAPGAQGCRLP